MMKRRRWLRPEFFSSEDVLALPIPARHTFLGLLMYADAFGRERLNSRLLKAAVWPLDDEITAEVVEEHLVLIDELGLIATYAAEGREHYEVTWDMFIPDKDPAASDVPPPPALMCAPTPETAQRAVSATSATSQRKERGREGEGETRERERGGDTGEQGRGAVLQSADDPREAPPPAPFCPRHPAGTEKPCKPCGNARLLFRSWQAAREYSEGESQ